MKHFFWFITIISMLFSFSFSQVKRMSTTNGMKDTVIVSNSIYLGTQGSGAGMDPLGGVVVFSTDNSQDGTGYFARACNGNHYYKSKPDTVIFSAVGSNLYFFVPQEVRSNNLNGQYNVSVNRQNIIMDSSNVLFLNERSEVLQINLQAGTKDTIVVSNCIYLGNQSSGNGMDPLGGVVIFSTNNLEDGTAYFDTVCAGTHYYKSKPDTVIFTSVGSALYLFVPQEGNFSSNMNGAYDVIVNGTHYSINSTNVIFLDELVTSVKNSKDNNPTEFSLLQNYPNPFNPSTTIEYQVPTRSTVEINVYNETGQLVRRLIEDTKEAGIHSVLWDGKDSQGRVVSSGTYFYQVRAGNFVDAKKMLLLK